MLFFPESDHHAIILLIDHCSTVCKYNTKMVMKILEASQVSFKETTVDSSASPPIWKEKKSEGLHCSLDTMQQNLEVFITNTRGVEGCVCVCVFVDIII